MTSIMIVLGNRLKDDSSITHIMKEWLDLAIKGYEIFSPTQIIVSGGVANKKAKISEAKAMYDYLVNNGIPSNKIIMENKSKTTIENALFSIPIALELSPNAVIVVTSIDHYSHDICKVFHNALGKKEIDLIFYTKNH